jgi:hypothetical protein
MLLSESTATALKGGIGILDETQRRPFDSGRSGVVRALCRRVGLNQADLSQPNDQAR